MVKTAELYGNEAGVLHIGFYDDNFERPVKLGETASFKVVFSVNSDTANGETTVAVNDCDFLNEAARNDLTGSYGSVTVVLEADNTDGENDLGTVIIID